MKRKFLIPASLALAASAAALFGACKATDTAGNMSAATSASKQSAPASGTTEVSADGVRRVTPAQLQQMVEAGTVAIYDTRAKAAYEQEHIKGSLSLPSNEVEARAGELPKGKTLVFYCT